MMFIKPILKIIPPNGQFMRILNIEFADQICTVKNSDRSQMNPKNFSLILKLKVKNVQLKLFELNI